MVSKINRHARVVDCDSQPINDAVKHVKKITEKLEVERRIAQDKAPEEAMNNKRKVRMTFATMCGVRQSIFIWLLSCKTGNSQRCCV